MAETNGGWSKWVIGTLGTLSLMFMGFYFNGVNADISALEAAKIKNDTMISEQANRLTGLEAREEALMRTLEQVSKDVRETRDAVIRQSIR